MTELIKEPTKMVNKLLKPGEDILKSLTPDKCDVLHMLIGLAGEYGELILALELECTEDILEEIGDSLFYLSGMENHVKYNPERPYLSQSSEISNYTLTQSMNLYGVNLGNLLDDFKKVIMYQKAPTAYEGKELPYLQELLGHILFLSTNLPVSSAYQHNLNKLLTGKKARYKQGAFSDEQAIERADKK